MRWIFFALIILTLIFLGCKAEVKDGETDVEAKPTGNIQVIKSGNLEVTLDTIKKTAEYKMINQINDTDELVVYRGNPEFGQKGACGLFAFIAFSANQGALREQANLTIPTQHKLTKFILEWRDAEDSTVISDCVATNSTELTYKIYRTY